jgi:hypothetical protein
MTSFLIVKFRKRRVQVKLPWWYGWKWFVFGLAAAVVLAMWMLAFMKP